MALRVSRDFPEWTASGVLPGLLGPMVWTDLVAPRDLPALVATMGWLALLAILGPPEPPG